MTLPDDIFSNISEFLPTATLAKFSLVSRDLYKIASNDHIWKPRIFSEFGYSHNGPNLKDKYIYQCKLQHNWKIGGGKPTTVNLAGKPRMNTVLIEGDILINGTSGGTLQFYNLPSKQIIKTAVKHKSTIWSMKVFGKNREMLATCGNDKLVNIWDLNSCTLITRLELTIQFGWMYICEKRNYLYGGSFYDNLQVWCLKTCKIVTTVIISDGVSGGMVSDGNLLYIPTSKCELLAMEMDTNTIVRRQKRAHHANICAIRIHEDKIYTVGDKSIACWDLMLNPVYRIAKGHSQMINDLDIVRVNQNLTVMVSTGRDNNIKTWNLKNGKAMWSNKSMHPDTPTQIIASQSDGFYSISDTMIKHWQFSESN